MKDMQIWNTGGGCMVGVIRLPSDEAYLYVSVDGYAISDDDLLETDSDVFAERAIEFGNIDNRFNSKYADIIDEAYTEFMSRLGI